MTREDVRRGVAFGVQGHSALPDAAAGGAAGDSVGREAEEDQHQDHVDENP